MKKTKIIYWIFTGILSAPILIGYVLIFGSYIFFHKLAAAKGKSNRQLNMG